MASPAQRALYGNIYNDSLGATGIWKAGMFHLLIGVAVILTVIRHTRAEEETGRAELIGSTAVGRYAGLTAALILAFGASLATGAIGAAALLGTSVPQAGSLAFGAALACSGLVFTAVAAVTAQLSTSARFARGAAFGVLAAAFTLRAAGDAGSAALSWLSPLGWSLQVRPYAGDRWWVLLLHLATTVLLTTLDYRLLAGRDVGAGLIAERPGPSQATPLLRNAFGLAWRLDRGALVMWTVGLCLYGLLIGSIGSKILEQAFIAAAFSMLGMMAAAFAVSLSLRLHQEETGQHTETLLSGSVSRSRWLTGHLVLALAGSAAAIVAAGVVAGLTYGVSAHDVGGKLLMVVGTALVQLPAVWLPAALAVALFGLAPRYSPVAWGVLVAFVALYLIGELSGFSQWVLDAEPFAHVPLVSGHTFTPVPLLAMLTIDAGLIVLGVAAFRRRDVQT